MHAYTTVFNCERTDLVMEDRSFQVEMSAAVSHATLAQHILVLPSQSSCLQL